MARQTTHAEEASQGTRMGVKDGMRAGADGAAPAPLLTRRELLYAGAGVAATAVVAGCAPVGKQAPAPTATPFKLTRAATVYVDATVPAGVGRAAVALIGGQAGIASAQVVASPTPAPDLILT